MNYKRLFVGILCMAGMTAMAQKPCTIEGEAMKGTEADKIYVYLERNNGGFADTPNDSIVVKKGKFSYTTTQNDVRRVYFIAKMKDERETTISTYLVPGEKAKLTFGNQEYYLNGSKFYKEWNDADLAQEASIKKILALRNEITSQLQSMSQEEQKAKMPEMIQRYNTVVAESESARNAYFEAHNGEEGCVMFYVNTSNDPAEMVALMEKLGNKMQGTRVESYLQKKYAEAKQKKDLMDAAEAKAAEAEKSTGAGMMFIDFEAEYNGKVQHLSDYVGKGKYVLVDFWASWCGPCKAEIPNLIKAYEKYKGDKFEVLGVATWDKPKDTERAIEQMKIPYPQIMNAQKAGSDAYGIQGIPQIILFAPDGKIVKRDLRGHDIEKTLQEIFGE